MSLSTGARLGPYEVLAPLGAGGMGEVWRAKDTRLGRQVAVKILPDAVSRDPGRVARFEREARALAALSHPNILAIHDFGESGGRLYAVAELLDGETLRDRMTGDRLTWRKAAELAAAIADGLASAHAAGIVHRDLKPENVFITSDGVVKILDFGLAKSAESVSEDAVTATSPAGVTLSAEGQILGTLSYMAPEQLRGLALDGRTDIFALGCVLFEMLSGKRPFAGATTADTISAILHAEPPPLDTKPAIPSALAAIVLRCLEKRPEDRFHTAHDLAIALRSSSSDRQAAVTSAGARPPKRRPWLVAGVAAATAVLLAVVIGALLKTSRSSPRGRSGEQSWGPPRRITSARGWDGEPAFSPDGTLVAYSSNASGKADIWVADPEGGEPLRLTDDAAEDGKPAWFPDGRTIAFVSVRNGSPSVWKISRLGGSPSLLVENADMSAISPDGTRIAFTRPGATSLPRIWVAPLADPTGAARLTGDEDGEWEHMDPAWSPDGTLLCYSAFRDLWLVPAAGGKARKLTREEKADREPVFTPDGKSILFSSNRVIPQSIWRVSLDGGAPERVLPGTGTANHPSLSPDGRRLVFSTAAIDRDVAVADLKAGTFYLTSSSGNDEQPAIAPDGSAVAYISNRLGTDDLWLQPLEEGRAAGKPPRRLTNLDPGPATPAFSPDGRWLAFFRAFKGHRDLWVTPLDGGEPMPLIENTGDNVQPAWSPDGTRLAFVSNRAGHEHVWVLAISGGKPVGDPWQLTQGDITDRFPAWSPDGRQIAFTRRDEVWLVEARPGAEPRRLTAGAEAHDVAWEPSGTTLLVSGLFGTPSLHLRRVNLGSGAMEPVRPHIVLGDRAAVGYLSLSRDGRILAVDITELKGNLWITEASRDGR